MKKIKLISLDLDGTLLDSERKLSDRNRRALQLASNQGISLVISTGSPYQLIPFSLLQGIEVDYAITANGSAVYDYRNGRCMFQETIPYEQAVYVIEQLRKLDIHTDFFVGGRAYTPTRCRELIAKLSVTESRKRYLRNNRTWVDDMNTILSPDSEQVQKITLNFYRDESGELMDYRKAQQLIESIPELDLTTGVKDNLEITKKDVDKGRAMRQLSRHLGMELSSIMAFGDSLNDLSVIQAAGTGVAMGNAMQELQMAADVIADTNDNDGVAIEIEKRLRRRSLV